MKTLYSLLAVLTLTACGAGKQPTVSHGLAATEACPLGDKAFAATVFPLIRGRCALCHDGQGRGPAAGPAFAVDKPAQAARAVRGLASGASLDASLLLRVGGNFHCRARGGGPACGASRDELRSAVAAWQTQGEATCKVQTGGYVTAPLPLPPFAPGKPFVKLSWDLGKLNPTLAGVRFQIEAQHYLASTATTKGAYIFRSPRLGTSRQALHIGGFKILLNGSSSAQSVTFDHLDRSVGEQPYPDDGIGLGPFPVLTSRSLLQLQERADGDQVAIAFSDLTPVSRGPDCRRPELFAPILTVIDSRACYSCHGGGSAHEPGTAQAKASLPLDGSPQQICRQALERANPQQPLESIFLAFPLGLGAGHPKATISAAEWEPYWSTWLSAEAAAAESDPR